MAHLLMMSGFETTMNMIGNALVTLLVNPEQLALLRAQPELLPNAMEELVRTTARCAPRCCASPWKT